MKTKTYFAFRVDVWDSAANSILEHIAGIDDFEVAVTTYWAAVARWPKARITLRQGARVVMKTWTDKRPDCGLIGSTGRSAGDTVAARAWPAPTKTKEDALKLGRSWTR